MTPSPRPVPRPRVAGGLRRWLGAVAGAVCAGLLARAAPAVADLEVHASKRVELQNMSVRGDFSQFLYENPTFLDGNRFDQNLRLEVGGTIGPNVSVDVLLDDSIVNDEEKRMRIDVAGRVWSGRIGRIPVALEGSRFLMAPRTGMGLQVLGRMDKTDVEVFAQRPEGRTHRNFFQGKGALQEYVLTDSAGLTNPLVVVGSERVTLDGRRLERGVDFEFDYLEGAVLLSSHLLPLDERNRLTVEFEEAGANGTGRASSVFGGRVTRRFGQTGEAWVSLGFAGEVDDTSEDASLATTGEELPAPGRIGVWEAAGQVPLGRGVLLEARGAISSVDTDVTSRNLGNDGATGAFDLELSILKRLFSVSLGRSLVDPGFRGVGLDRFQTVGERRFAARDGWVNHLDAKYTPHDSLEVRAGFRQGETNLAKDPTEAEERVDTATVEADLRRVLGGSVDLRFLDERSRTRAPGATEEVASGRARGTVIHSRNLGRVGLSLTGEVEDAERGGDAAESYISGGAELTGPGTSKLRWSLGGSRRDVHRGDPADPTRQEANAHLALSTELGRALGVSLDGRHRREDNLDLGDTTRPPVAETNTGEARLRYEPGDKLRVESQLTAEVRSRIFLDRVDDYQNQLESRDSTPAPQTAVNPNPVLNRGQSHTVTYLPDDDLEVSLGYRLQKELDSVTQERRSRDEGADGRVVYLPAPGWRVAAEAGGGRTENTASNVDRLFETHRIEVARDLGASSNLTLERNVEDLDNQAAPTLSEYRRKDRLGLERRLNRNLTARAGLSQGLEDRQGRRDLTGFDMGVDWDIAGGATRIGLGVEVEDARGQEARAAEDRARKRYNLSAAGRLGKEGFLDMNLALTSAGADGRGGTGYRSLTSNISVGVDF